MKAGLRFVEKYLEENISDNALKKLIHKAWKVRGDNFGNVIEFVKPYKTIPVSVTGAECELNCAHCGKHYLCSMVPVSLAYREAEKREVKSCLVSGGCDLNGKVKFNLAINEIKDLRKKYKINMHIGMVGDADIEELGRLADVVSFDIPSSDKVVKEVYGLDFTVENYVNLYRKLKCKVKVVPHICIGLDGNGIESELAILDMLEQDIPKKLCYIVFKPTHSTRLEKRPPPEVHDVLKLIAHTRIRMPDTDITLGCMRPGGSYRRILDEISVFAGATGIVMPSESAVRTINELGMKTKWKEECCAL